jgi:N-acetylneuraminic acid mutarotase
MSAIRTLGPLLMALGLWACQPTPYSPTQVPAWSPSASKPSLFLEVQSPEGSPVAGARVRLGAGARYETDAQGQLLLKELEAGETLVRVEAEGFAPAARSFTLGARVQAGSRIPLVPLGPSKPFDTTRGTSLEDGDVSVTIPPGTLLDAEGQPLDGEVEAFFRALDLGKDELRLSPGEQLGVVSPELPPVPLESLGIMVLDFRRKSPALGALAQGPHEQGVTRPRLVVRGRAPSSVRVGSSREDGDVQASALAEPRQWRVPIWRLDELTGFWVYTGALGTLVESATEPRTYSWIFEMADPPRVINVALPYWWHSAQASRDNPLQVPTPPWVETACLRVTVQDFTGTPVVGRTVLAQGVDYVGLSRGTTGLDGSVLLEVMRGRNVRVSSGDVSLPVQAGSLAGNCEGKGADPVPVALGVPPPLCAPGAERVCAYSGPPGTQGLGVCRAPVRYCDAEGSAWSDPCRGEVLPGQEQCGNAVDDDCDGAVNEDCATVCREGATRRCYEGPPGTRGVGACREGTQTCVPGGTAWSACVGQVLPEAAERCALPGDEDCDGTACVCRPGETQRCGYAGPGGTENVGACRASFKTCNDSGTAWSTCTGEVTPERESCATPLDDDCDGQVNEDPSCVCTPFARQGCYSGPEGTRGVGLCQAGSQQCNASGTAWGECTGDVTPQPESCANALDDDCNGQVNDAAAGCVCLPNSSQGCYSGPVGTRGVGICQAGTHVCDPSGMAWGACTGEVLPLAQEDCTTDVDDDCNGEVNEGSVCICTPNSIQGCPYSGPGGTQDVGVCRAGAQTCNASGTAWGACLGEVTPQAESCLSAWDEDCDGQRNEAPPCGWAAVASLAEARSHHQAVVLNDGRVLVMGGVNPSDVRLTSAELYDPATRTWKPTASMNAARKNFVAVKLNDGTVLAVGGWNSGQLKSAEVYDPVAKTWTLVGDMLIGREKLAATLLSNGKVLVTGGNSKTTELYDPVAKTWSSVASMSVSRADHTATLLANGKVLVAGGYNASAMDKTAEVYDPNANTWKSVGDMNSARTVHAATLLNNGKVLVAGGYNGTVTVKTAEVYDPVSETWTLTGSMGTARDEPRAVLLSSGHVLITGGDDTATATATAELYDPVAGTWTPLASMTAARSAHTLVVLGNGEVLVTGGWAGTALATAELYNVVPPQANTWRGTGSMAVPRKLHTATVLNTGQVLVVGGLESNFVTASSAELYDPGTGTWTGTGALSGPRHTHTATVLNDGKVLVVGGYTGSAVLNTAEVYNPATGTWSPTTSTLVSARREHTATLLANGKVLVTGGNNASITLNTAELYDPATGQWTATGSMATPRERHVALRLKNGRVLVMGGYIGNGNYDKTAEIYDPDTGLFTPTSSMASARNWFAATLLNDTEGSVFVVGGFNFTNKFLGTAEVYTPGAAASWSPAGTGGMASPREKHTAAPLGTDRVLVVGGNDYVTDFQMTEVYDLNSHAWAPGAPMTEGRSWHAMVVLGDGQVLVIGGRKGTGALKTAELYKP